MTSSDDIIKVQIEFKLLLCGMNSVLLLLLLKNQMIFLLETRHLGSFNEDEISSEGEVGLGCCFLRGFDKPERREENPKQTI